MEVQELKKRCEEGYTIIDLDEGKIKQYTKASRISRDRVVQAQKALSPQFHQSLSPSELFKFLGVDLVD